jgi:signal transduction histidine kinase
MRTETPVRELVAQFQQLLECAGACLLLECPDPDLRHPVLDLLPPTFVTRIPSSANASAKLFPPAFFADAQVQAHCDLTLQSGCLGICQLSASWRPTCPLQYLVVVALERPAGLLGLLLLTYDPPEQPGPGEQQLLAHCLPEAVKCLEQFLWKQIHISRPGVGEQILETPARGSGEQFVSSEMVSMIGHELRAPLSVIKGYIALLQMCGSASAELELPAATQLHYLEVVMEQTDLLELLVNDLLDITRLQQGQLTLKLTAVATGPFCQQIAQLGQLRADQQAEGKHRVICTIAPELPPMQADPDRLRQVLLNVVENAIKYSPHGGCIELTAESTTLHETCSHSEHTFVRIKVRDEGVGIPAAHTRRLFRPFERLERPATASIPGIGLGLYIARQLIEAMGGYIEIESIQNQCTTVTILLPTADANEQPVHNAAYLQPARDDYAGTASFPLRP